MAKGQAAAGLDEARVTLRYGESQPGWHQGPPAARGDRDVGARTDVGAGIAGTGVTREARGPGRAGQPLPTTSSPITATGY